VTLCTLKVKPKIGKSFQLSGIGPTKKDAKRAAQEKAKHCQEGKISKKAKFSSLG
jgi:hypothetical protein